MNKSWTRIAVWLVVALLVSLWNVPLTHAAELEEYEYVKQIPEPWHEFTGLEDLAADQAGNVYVVDRDADKVLKYGPGGEPLAEHHFTEEANYSLAGIGIDDVRGFVYVADENNGVFKLDLNLNLLDAFDMTEPSDVAVDSHGNVFVVERIEFENLLHKYSPDGVPDASWADGGYLNYNFNTGNIRFAIDGADRIYVPDAGGWLRVLTADGEIVQHIDMEGQDSNITFPGVGAIDEDGNIYVHNGTGYYIHIFNADGILVDVIGEYGNKDGQFYYTTGIALGPDGAIIVADSYNKRIQRLAPDHRVLSVWGSFGGGPGRFDEPKAMETDSAGNLYVVDSANNRIQALGPDGQYRFQIGDGSRGIADGQFIQVQDLAVDEEAGAIYAIDLYSERVQAFDMEGNFLRSWGDPGNPDPYLSMVGYTGIALGPDGFLYVTDDGDDSIVILDKDGATQGGWSVMHKDDPKAIAVDDAGNILVSFGDSIATFNATGEELAEWTEFAPEGSDIVGYFGEVEDLAMDGEGNVYAADADGAVYKLSPEGGLLAVIGQTDLPYAAASLVVLPLPDPPGQLYSPSGIAVAANGYVYASDAGKDRISVFRPVGEDDSEPSPSPSIPPEEEPAAAELTSLTVSPGTLTPAFDASVTEYTVNVGHTADRATVTATFSVPDSDPVFFLSVMADPATPTLTVTGAVYGEYASGEPIVVPLRTGSNEMMLTLSAEDSSRTYALDIRRAAAPVTGGGGGGYSPPKLTLDDVLKIETEGDTTFAAFDHAKLKDYLKQEGELERLTIDSDEDSRVLELALQEEDIEALQANNEELPILVQTPNGSYELPLGAIRIADIKRQMGLEPEETLRLRLLIERMEDGQQASMKANLADHGLTAIAGIVGFKVQALAEGRTLTLESFGNVYVNRTIPLLNEEIDPDRTTGVWVDPDGGAYRFVPTLFEQQDGQWTALLKRQGNSFYTIVEHDRTFDDIRQHWAREDIEVLASKLLVFGMTEERYAPAAPLTRAQYAALVARALGLDASGTEDGSEWYDDVRAGTWFEADAAAVSEAGIMQGSNGRFEPNRLITRQELAVVLAKASEFIGAWDGAADASDVRAAFADEEQVSDWAWTSVAYLVDLGVMQGKTTAEGLAFAPNDGVTRAEAAATLRRWLQAARLIN